MTPQAFRLLFYRSSLLLLCGLSGALAFYGGCAFVGSSSVQTTRLCQAGRSSLHRVLGHSTRNHYTTQSARDHDQGTRTGGEAGKDLIRQAINAFELASQIRTREALPVQWEQTMRNLKIAKKTLEDMK